MSGCETCFLKRYAERNPDSWLGRLWRWHTGWCPGWRAYQDKPAKTGQEKES